MKILEITNVDFSLRHFLLPLMRGLRADGHEVVGVCADGPLLADVRGEGFRVETVPLVRSFSPLAQMQALIALVRLIREEKPDIVHAHMPISGLLGRLAAWLCRVPCVAYTCHGFLFNQPGPAPRRGLALVLEWLAGRITDRYFTVSVQEAEDARRLKIHPAPLAVGNGRNPSLFQPDPEARRRIRAELGVAEGAVVIIAVSRLVRHKGYPELLKAMEQVSGAMLWVVGERLESDHGESLDSCFEEAQRVLGARLRCLGYREDVPALLAAADIFTLPSHFEGLPMSVIEAMLTGLPVVASDIRGPREQVVNGRTGLLVPPGEAVPLARSLGCLVRDPDLRYRMGEVGRERARARYDEDIVVGRTKMALLAPGTTPTDDAG
ncbi:glycosyl transferase group 1 [Gluconacetobacter diazotrophicus PA1 5]|uniref:Glycosyltransferase family 4 protein n=2 Tax=Gluconacetobacter diazotrophicus TaxID=33996 RepID=A0A7W4FEM3_GLUDI|nr:glycosyltransferase family 4 protein [Gluconacetobacter diazotrophicus]ACI50416.1 glycosyl transferase group 1 [Gluconacetobacter diazotrophicus PA1 5]MBB2156325.1 glycosyltransferase family 4 protein [Gluconacetobacter diazotrophicus]TWB08289.1 glycosyltransferase involved in cell wall biosynthesis [Gluconacetobacter diazotrophicus]CAP56323.1 putative capsular polysaccharide biosynthesis glycosyl transferase cap [Gluconacetobacter diazotrophicus PA1 5]